MAMTPDGATPRAQQRAMSLRASAPTAPTGSVGGRASGTITTQRPKVSGAGSKPKISANASGNYARPVAPPTTQPGPVVDINAYLNQDAGYQQQLREFAKAMQDFTGDVTRRRGDLGSNFDTSKKALGDQRELDLKGIEDDYGARGLIRSGLYADARGNYEKEYGNRVTDLSNQQNQALAALMGEEGQFKSAQDLKTQAAREDAIRRRAELMGV